MKQSILAAGDLTVTSLACTSPWILQPETILFHHGLGARSECWHGWISALTDQYRLVFFDMRGHGSSPVSVDHVWSLESMLADLDTVVSAAIGEGEKLHLVGESIGGTIALAYATRQCSRLLSLTVSNGAHQGGSLNNLANWQQIMQNGGMAAWSQHMMQMRFAPDSVDERMWQWYETQQAECDQRSVLAAVELLIGADLSDQLGNITVPALILHPDSSPFIPVAVVAHLKTKLPDARLNVFAEARHGLPFSHAGLCAATMRDFLRTL